MSWEHELRCMITNPSVLLQWLEIDQPIYVPSDFPMRVTRSFMRRMIKKNTTDPLLLQVLPMIQEKEHSEGFYDHPNMEHLFNKKPRILHKYHGRVLVILTQGCAIHCRYCFRKNFDYQGQMCVGYDEIVAYIKQHPEVKEVILSGGDPLILSNELLERWIEAFSSIAHLEIIRIHSRIPIVLPSRIDVQLCQLFTNPRFRWVLVIHCNHPQEIDDEVIHAMQKIPASVHVFNQSVLLHRVNDCAETLIQLSWKLFHMHVLPYYLHILDPVTGSAHFSIVQEKAKSIYYEMRAQLPGYLTPLLVQERPNQSSKMPIV